MSVILPAYNCPRYIGAALDSILEQTFQDFEVIVIDDGSTDETPEIIRSFTDPRVQFLSQANIGLAATLNRGIGLARGRYIARQDQDDRSHPDRFARQVAYLEGNPTCGMVGTWAEIWRESAKTQRVHAHPAGDAELKFLLLLNNPFVHSSVMLQKAALERVGGYSIDPMRQPPEDYELWSRLARAYEVANIPELLHVYREVDGSMSRTGRSPFLDHLVTISAENIAWAADTRPDDPNVVNLAALEHGAMHRMVGDPDFATMLATFRQAVARVTGNEGQRFGRDAEQHVAVLERRWRNSRFPRRWLRGLRDAGRRVSGRLS